MYSHEIAEFAERVHQTALEKGWHEEGRSFGDLIALGHSELSEALEEFRAGCPLTQIYFDDKGKPCGIPIELADLVIRVFDMAEKYGINIAEALEMKSTYNESRPHRHGGKRL